MTVRGNSRTLRELRERRINMAREGICTVSEAGRLEYLRLGHMMEPEGNIPDQETVGRQVWALGFLSHQKEGTRARVWTASHLAISKSDTGRQANSRAGMRIQASSTPFSFNQYLNSVNHSPSLSIAGITPRHHIIRHWTV